MGHPFKKDKTYFIKTITFFYLAVYKGRKGKFFEFDNVRCILSVDDWQDFWKSRPHLPPSMKPLDFPPTAINADMIVEACLWE